MRKLTAMIAMALCLNAGASAKPAMYVIENPAAKISNPADKMYNPATQVNNPASNIYNPAGRMNNPNPLSPPTQPGPQPAVTEPQPTVTEATTAAKPAKQITEQPRPKSTVPQKSYYFKTVKEYISAAKKAFIQDDFVEFLSITEDALRRIHAGTLKASKKSREMLVRYKMFGYGFLEK